MHSSSKQPLVTGISFARPEAYGSRRIERLRKWPDQRHPYMPSLFGVSGHRFLSQVAQQPTLRR